MFICLGLLVGRGLSLFIQPFSQWLTDGEGLQVPTIGCIVWWMAGSFLLLSGCQLALAVFAVLLLEQKHISHLRSGARVIRS